jgi:hypothetical protein
MSDRCTGRAQPRTTPLHGRYDHIITSARHITLAPPLSRWIHLVRKDDASCHLGGHAGAWHSSEPVVRVCGPLFLARRVGQPASHEGAWWHAGEHGIRSSGSAEEGSHLVLLADVPNSSMPTAAGACRSRSSDRRHIVHDDAAVHAQLLERPDVPVAKIPLASQRHTAHAHDQQLHAA